MQTRETRTADKSTARLVLWILAEAPQALTLEEIKSKVVLDDGQSVLEVLGRLTEAGMLVRRDKRWALSADIPGVDLWSESAGDDAFEPTPPLLPPLKTTIEGREKKALLEYLMLMAAGGRRAEIELVVVRYAEIYLQGIISDRELSKFFSDFRRLPGLDSEDIAALKNRILAFAFDALAEGEDEWKLNELLHTATQFLLSPDEDLDLDLPSPGSYPDVTIVGVGSTGTMSDQVLGLSGSISRIPSSPARPTRGVRRWFLQLVDKIAPHTVRPATTEVTLHMKAFFDMVGPPPGWTPDDVDAAEATHGR